jgi:CxxC motif-containing protein (DUF1111 family)
MKRFVEMSMVIVPLLCAGACTNDDDNIVKKAQECKGECLSGGELGTALNATSFAYQQPSPAVERQGMSLAFKRGESFFDEEFLPNTEGVRKGLGPVYLRRGCQYCHPNYGHGKRMDRYRERDFGNSYFINITDMQDNYLPQLGSATLTGAVPPWLPPLDETRINIEWIHYVDDDGNTFPDGETYDLIYPVISIPRDAFILEPPLPEQYIVRMEASIGFYGIGLLDAIPQDSIIAYANKLRAMGIPLHEEKFDPNNYYEGLDGLRHIGRFTYEASSGTLQHGPGASSVSSVPNVMRSNYPALWVSQGYARAVSAMPDMQQALGISGDSIYNYLTKPQQEPEMTDAQWIDFMVWLRGLAVPAARNLDNPIVQRGRAKFYEIGCTICHKPSWTTGADNYTGDPLVADKLPRYQHQTIYPYTDMLQHRLGMVKDVRTGWCRTTPLWGRGLSEKCTGAGDHLHDMRARNYTEAIMWHGGDAQRSKDKYRNLSKDDRDAIIKFLEAI